MEFINFTDFNCFIVGTYMLSPGFIVWLSHTGLYWVGIKLDMLK